MKKFIFIFAVFAACYLFNTTQVQSQALGFYIANNTGVTLNNVYVTPAETTNWGNDILPNDLFENQSTIQVYIPESYGSTCKFDIKITDLQGNAVVFYNVDACKLHTLTIHWDGTYEIANM